VYPSASNERVQAKGTLQVAKTFRGDNANIWKRKRAGRDRTFASLYALSFAAGEFVCQLILPQTFAVFFPKGSGCLFWFVLFLFWFFFFFPFFVGFPPLRVFFNSRFEGKKASHTNEDGKHGLPFFGWM